MNGVRGRLFVLIGALSLGVGAGCSDPKDMEIAALREELQRLQALSGQADEMSKRLAAAMDEANAARARASQLQSELDNCLANLATAKRPIIQQLPEGWQGTKEVAWVNIAEDILFDSGKADLKSTGRSRLEQIRGDIRSRFTNHNVWVVGHTDTDPIVRSKWRDNLDLSLARGRVVGEALLSMGLPNRDVVIGGQGPWNPIAPNDTKPNKQQNRRVQILAVLRPTPGAAPAAAQ